MVTYGLVTYHLDFFSVLHMGLNLRIDQKPQLVQNTEAYLPLGCDIEIMQLLFDLFLKEENSF